MEKTKEMPWWVFLAFSSIETRKGALNLIGIIGGFDAVLDKIFAPFTPGMHTNTENGDVVIVHECDSIVIG